ncbi:MAG: DUF502 domain-containing protein [Xanthomonadales bacterium]|nr:DUF502 domain-containing protein [Xanthomonadales bacterium]
MQTIGKLFLKGLVVVIPVALTLAILWWLASGAEQLLGRQIEDALPTGWYVPGMGLLSAVALVMLVGLLSHVLLFQRLFLLGEGVLNRLPVVKTIYAAIKDFVHYLSPGRDREFSKAVMVTLPGTRVQALGFVTREEFSGLGLPLLAADPVAVYLPMSYQIGGYTLFLERAAVTPLDMPFEEAMRLALTGGVSRHSRDAP